MKSVENGRMAHFGAKIQGGSLVYRMPQSNRAGCRWSKGKGKSSWLLTAGGWIHSLLAFPLPIFRFRKIMAEEFHNIHSRRNRPFRVLMWVLGLFAVGQLLAVGWAVMRHQPSVRYPDGGGVADSTASASPALAGIPEGGLPPMPEVFRKQMAAADSSAPPSTARNPGGNSKGRIAPGTPPSSSLLADTTRLTHPAHRISDPEIERLLETGIVQRVGGNMNAALRSMQSAEAKSPDHPRILSEIAGTYSQMGLDDKAATYWERVYHLGENRAGAYFDMADMVLKGKQLEQQPRQDSLLSIDDIAEIRDRGIAAGERMTLRISTQASPGSQPKGQDMAVLVYFYDLVDGKQFLPSTADTSESYISAPYDWRDGQREVIEVTYYQPEFTAEQKRVMGERVYFGYIVELYYRNELQDVVAMPRKLRKLDSNAHLLPQGETGGPDNSLFPK